MFLNQPREKKIDFTLHSIPTSIINLFQPWENVLLPHLHTHISLHVLLLMCIFQFGMHSLMLLNNNICCITQGHGCPQKTRELIT